MALAKRVRQRTVQRREQESFVQAPPDVVENPREPHHVSDLPSLEVLAHQVAPVVIAFESMFKISKQQWAFVNFC